MLRDGDPLKQVASLYLEEAIADGWFPELAEAAAEERGPEARTELSRSVTKAAEVGLDPEARPDGLVSLAQLLADPVLSEPPRAVVPGLAWRGRVTLLAAREKLGKSTLAAAGAAAVSQGGTFLGEPTPIGRVLLVALEEHRGDVARRLTRFGAAPSRTFVLERTHAPHEGLRQAVRSVEPTLVVVDTLAALMEPLGLDSGDASAWTSALTPLVRVARSTDAALLLLHHASRAGGYRDSTAIGASVDVLVEMRERSGLRLMQVRGRWHSEELAVRLVEAEDFPRFERVVEGTEPSTLMDRVFRYVRADPGHSTREVRAAVEGRADAIGDALHALLESGRVTRTEDGPAHRWWPMSSPQDPCGSGTEPPSGTVGTAEAKRERARSAEVRDRGSTREQPGTALEPVRNRLGTGDRDHRSRSGSRPPHTPEGGGGRNWTDGSTDSERVPSTCPSCEGGMSPGRDRCETCADTETLDVVAAREPGS